MNGQLIKDSFSQYLAREELSRGRIVSEIENTPKKAQYDEEQGTETTDPMRLGSAAHCSVLEPERFLTDFIFYDGTRSAKKGGIPSGKWALFLGELEEAGHEYLLDQILKKEEYDYCLALQAFLATSKKWQALIDGTDKEVSCYWDGKKARLDARRTGLIVDLKTAYDLSDHGIEKALGVSNMIQVAHYIEGAEAADDRTVHWDKLESSIGLTSFVFAFVSKSLPIELRLVEVPFEHVKRAAAERHNAIESIKMNRKTGIYPTYPDRIETLSPKPYIFD